MARDPVDAFLSFYEYLPAYANLLPGDLEPQQFADARLPEITRDYPR